MSQPIGIAEEVTVMYITLDVGCWECCEQTEVLYAGQNLEAARGPLLDALTDGYHGRHPKIELGPSFPSQELSRQLYRAHRAP